MPIREYYCEQCRAEFEELVFGNEIPPCTVCGSTAVEPLMSCCAVRTADGNGGYAAPSGGGCAGCGGGHCATCH